MVSIVELEMLETEACNSVTGQHVRNLISMRVHSQNELTIVLRSVASQPFGTVMTI